MQLDGEPDLLADLVEVFADDASARLEALREALIQADADGIAKTAHTLKGSAGNCGASRMSHSAA
jgi:HPt (histidine-containing phosphotransfer) domain-containing protein